MQGIVVTGIGVVSAAGLGTEAFWEACVQGTPPGGESVRLPDLSLDPFTAGVGMRRMERFSKLVLAAGSLALADADLADGGREVVPRDRIGSVVTTVYGPINVTVKYLDELIRLGPDQVSPIYFQQTVMNVASGQLSIKFQLQGVSSTLVGSSSVAYAVDLLRFNRADVVLAIGVEELCEQVLHAYRHAGLLTHMALGEGCGVLVLERAEHAARRGARVYGEIVDYATYADRLMNRHVGVLEAGGESALALTMGRWTAEGQVPAAGVGLVSRLGNGAPAVEEAERELVERFYPGAAALAVKRTFGETLGAAEVFSLIGALLSLQREVVPVGGGKVTPLRGSHAVVNSLFVGGSVNSWLLRRAG